MKTCRPSVAADCAANEYCKVVNCAASGGTCTKKPTTIPTTGPIICGCDNITYWNEALAASFGVSVMKTTACGATGRSCSDVNKCPDKRYCNRQTSANNAGVCAIDPTGTCWGVPDPCPSLTNGKARPCGANQNQCKTFCEAVRAEAPWFEDQGCN